MATLNVTQIIQALDNVETEKLIDFRLGTTTYFFDDGKIIIKKNVVEIEQFVSDSKGTRYEN